ncbi:MAG: TetR/AcrR family transcriptional regulator [Pseudomonadota bacterium]
MPRRPSFDRDELIDRARDLFWRQGWAGTSLKDLEATLQLKPGSFYAAFGSKDALFALTLEKYANDGRERLNALAAKVGPLKALQDYPMMLISGTNAPTKACMLAKTVLELQAKNHALAKTANALLSRAEAQFASLFTAAQQAKEIDGSHDPQALARRYQSDLIGLRVSAERKGVDATGIADEIADGLARLA